MNLSKFYRKNINPSCSYCLYCESDGEQMKCEKGNDAALNKACNFFKYEPTMREPKTLPLLSTFKPEDFQI